MCATVGFVDINRVSAIWPAIEGALHSRAENEPPLLEPDNSGVRKSLAFCFETGFFWGAILFLI
jgi:hypothetical protein